MQKLCKAVSRPLTRSMTATRCQLAATWLTPSRAAESLDVDVHGGTLGRCKETEHSGDLGDDIGISNLSCYRSGLMGYHTPNIDRPANEAVQRGTLALDRLGRERRRVLLSSSAAAQQIYLAEC